MKLQKNIFQIIEDNLIFFNYLMERQKFTTKEVCNKFNLKYQTLIKHLKEWESQGFILKEKQPPMLGGPKYKYFLSEKAFKKLRKVKSLSIKIN
ncbi:MAG: hypothetical protein ACFFCI_10950 [Promethearchaeota archaeon]